MIRSYILEFDAELYFNGVFNFRNIPHIHLHEKRDNKDRWHGAEIQVVIEGNWTTYRVYDTSSFPIILFEFHRCLSILEFLDD